MRTVFGDDRDIRTKSWSIDRQQICQQPSNSLRSVPSPLLIALLPFPPLTAHLLLIAREKTLIDEMASLVNSVFIREDLHLPKVEVCNVTSSHSSPPRLPPHLHISSLLTSTSPSSPPHLPHLLPPHLHISSLLTSTSLPPHLHISSLLTSTSPSSPPHLLPPHLHISSLLTSTPSHLLTSTSPPSSPPHLLPPHLHISSPPHLHTSTSPPHFHISSPPHLHISSPPHLLTSTSPHLHISSPPHLLSLLTSTSPLPPHQGTADPSREYREAAQRLYMQQERNKAKVRMYYRSNSPPPTHTSVPGVHTTQTGTHYGTLPKRKGNTVDVGEGDVSSGPAESSGSVSPSSRSLPNEKTPRSGSWHSNQLASSPVMPPKYALPPEKTK